MNIANLITLGNGLSGIFSIALSLKGEIVPAAHFIYLGMILDFLDGKVARMTQSSSIFGKYLDSFADFITFGLAPVFLIEMNDFNMHSMLIAFSLFFYCFCSVFRLIRFCMNSKDDLNDSFCGLPTPASAGCLVSYLLIIQNVRINISSTFLIILIITSSLLMISRVPYNNFSSILRCVPLQYKYLALPVCIVWLVTGNYQILLFILFFMYLMGIEIVNRVCRGKLLY